MTSIGKLPTNDGVLESEEVEGLVAPSLATSSSVGTGRRSSTQPSRFSRMCDGQYRGRWASFITFTALVLLLVRFVDTKRLNQTIDGVHLDHVETKAQVTPTVVPVMAQTEPPVQPTEPPVQSTEPPVQPTEPPVQPTEPPVQPTEPPVDVPKTQEPVATEAPKQPEPVSATPTPTDPPVPAPTSPPVSNGTVHYATSKLAGWNNQRQAAMSAWIISYFTGHTLEYQNYRPAKTGVAADLEEVSHGELFDPAFLERYVRVKYINHTQKLRRPDYRLDCSSVVSSSKDVEAMAPYRTIHWGCAWAFLQKAFPWLNPFATDRGKEVYQKMVRSFTYSAAIQALAEKIVAQIGVPFIGVHVRKGRAPALRCADYGLKRMDGPPHSKFSWGGCEGIGWSNVVEKVFPNTSLPVFVATDGKVKVFRSDYTMQSFQDEIDELRPIIQSAVEQEILIRAKYLISSTHSSWSEYVILKRALTNTYDGKKNYDIWTENQRWFLDNGF